MSVSAQIKLTEKKEWQLITTPIEVTGVQVAYLEIIKKVLEEAKASFVSLFEEGKYNSDYERAKANQEWFERWFCSAEVEKTNDR